MEENEGTYLRHIGWWQGVLPVTHDKHYRNGPHLQYKACLDEADRADAGAAAAVRDAEGLVQVEVADIRADQPRLDEPDLHMRQTCKRNTQHYSY